MISDVKVYGIHESIIACRYPMSVEIGDVGSVSGISDTSNGDAMCRAKSLSMAKLGSGHSNFLKGITVQFNWKNSLLVQRQVLRYNFLDIVSSQSLMHRTLQLDIGEQCNDYVCSEILNKVKGLILDYNSQSEYLDHDSKRKLELKILYSMPSGMQLTARYTTNYLQLKTVYQQRKNHKLPEWREFCRWVESLPYSELIIGGIKDEDN